MAYPYRPPATAVDLAEGGVPDDDPGPAVAPRYREFRGRDLLVCQGQRVNPGELTLYDAADMLWGEMRNPLYAVWMDPVCFHFLEGLHDVLA